LENRQIFGEGYCSYESGFETLVEAGYEPKSAYLNVLTNETDSRSDFEVVLLV
jgi:ketol-acid reductoisomerase